MHIQSIQTFLIEVTIFHLSGMKTLTEKAQGEKEALFESLKIHGELYIRANPSQQQMATVYLMDNKRI